MCFALLTSMNVNAKPVTGEIFAMKSLLGHMTGLLTAVLIMTLPLDAAAGTYSGGYQNQYQTDSIYLFLYDDNPSLDAIFQDVNLSNPDSWSIVEHTDTYLNLKGLSADPGSVMFDITFSDGRNPHTKMIDFRMEWAEYLNGAPSETNAMGTLLVERKGKNYNWSSTSDFSSPIPNPLPASTWMLLSGLFFLAGFRRHTRH